MRYSLCRLEFDKRESLKAHIGNNERMLTIKARVLIRDDGVGHRAPCTSGKNRVLIAKRLGPH